MCRLPKLEHSQHEKGLNAWRDLAAPFNDDTKVPKLFHVAETKNSGVDFGVQSVVLT
jgi:hypothetical protein